MSEEVEELLIGYVLDQLSPEEHQTVERLLDEHPEMAQSLQKLETLLGLMAHHTAAVPPPRLRAKILSAAQAQSLMPQPKRAWPKFQKRDWVIAALMTIAISVSFDNWQLRQKLTVQDAALSALQDAQTNVFKMRATTANLKASGSVLLDLQAGYAVVVLQNLPPLPKGEAYHLWAFTPNAKILCGRFELGATERQINIPLSHVQLNAPVRFMRISREAVQPVQTTQVKRTLVMTSES